MSTLPWKGDECSTYQIACCSPDLQTRLDMQNLEGQEASGEVVRMRGEVLHTRSELPRPVYAGSFSEHRRKEAKVGSVIMTSIEPLMAQ